MGAFMDILEKAKQNIEVISLSFKWVLPLLFILMVAVYVVKLIGYVWFEIDLRIVFENYPLLTVGMPLAALLALGLVLSLEQKTDNIRFKAFAIELEGVAGQLILWVICFLSIVGAMKWIGA